MGVLRRTFVMIAACIASMSAGVLASAARADERPPNIVLFVSDDHRADVLGCAGHPIVRTPAIDTLAREGTRFANAYVTTSICAASRATILSGVVERTHRFTFGTPPLAETYCEESYPRLLREHGYRTGFVGKLGTAVAGSAATLERMFDSFVPIGRSPYMKTMPDGSTRHATDLTGDAAIEFIRATPGDQPFCLSVSFNAGHAEDHDLADHYPFPEREATLYRDAAMPPPRLEGEAVAASVPAFLGDSLNRRRYAWRWDTPEKYDRNLRNYFRMISGLDRNIARVMDELATRRLDQRTVVIFTSDNGYYMGERGFAGKWSHYEQSLRVPLVIRDPRVPADGRGIVADAIALNLDLAPTILDLAGVRRPARYQGRSLAAFLGNADAPDTREGFYCEHRMMHPQLPRWEGYHTRRHVYARYLDVDEGGELLHDLELDPDQLRNFAGDPGHAAVLADLRARCRDHSARYAAAGRPLPRVLLLGDSISMGYHPFVVETLAEAAIVVRPRENCEGTTKARQRLQTWLQLDGGGFDVIHFNFGLHDLKRVTAPGQRSGSNDPRDPRQAEIEVYERNLRELVPAMKATGATLVFATTTPVPPGGVRPHRDVDDPARYNAAARRVMAEHDVAINDLHGFALSRLGAIQRPVDVHFTEAGSKALAAEVARHVRLALRSRPTAGRR